MWYVYILLCKGNFLYTGITKDVARRFKEHQNKSTRFTSYNSPLKIVYTECCLTRSQALKREAQIKRLRKPKKIALIKNHKLIKKQKVTGTVTVTF